MPYYSKIIPGVLYKEFPVIFSSKYIEHILYLFIYFWDNIFFIMHYDFLKKKRIFFSFLLPPLYFTMSIKEKFDWSENVCRCFLIVTINVANNPQEKKSNIFLKFFLKKLFILIVLRQTTHLFRIQTLNISVSSHWCGQNLALCGLGIIKHRTLYWLPLIFFV